MDLHPLLDELQAAYLVRPIGDSEPSFLFSHVLTQETAYRSLLLRGRRELHLRVAEAIEREYAGRLDDHIPTLAYHYGEGGDLHQAAHYAHLAGDRALRVYALREAVGYYAQALGAIDQLPTAAPEEICDVILGWAEAAFGFEPYPRQLEQLGRAEKIARERGDKRRLALVLHTIGKVHIASGHPFRAGAALEECFTLATDLGDEKLSVIPTFYMGTSTYDSDPRGALKWFDRAIELARKYGDVDVQAYAISMKALVEARLGADADSRADLEQASQLVPSIKSPMCDSDVHLYSAFAFLDLGDVDQGLEYAKLGVQKAVSADNVECACFAFACLGLGHLRADQISEAVLAFEEAIRRSRISGAEPAEILGEMGLGITRFLSGHPEGIQGIEHALEHADKIGEEFLRAVLGQTLGEIYLQQGDAGLAATRLGQALVYFRRHGMRPYLSRALELYALALEHQGKREEADAARAERAILERGMPGEANSTKR